MFKINKGIIIGILFVGFFFWLMLSKNNDQSSNTSTVPKVAPTLGVDDYRVTFPETLKKIETVNWNSEIRQNYPSEIKKISVARKMVDEKREAEIKKYFGISEQNGYVLKDQNYIQYTNMPNNLDKVPITIEWNIGELKNRLRKIASDLNKETGLEVVWTRTSYRKYNQPYIIETTQNEAQFLEISGDYIVNGTRLSTFHGESIKAYFDGKGNLIKISIYLKPEIKTTDSYWQIMTVEEAKNSPINNYRAGVNDLYDDIEKVNITQTSLVQIYDNLEENVNPFFLLEGNTFSSREKKPVNLSILLKAEK
jgi:hypothetical protein